MSILDFPRIHFRGFARVNVPTGNRNSANSIDQTSNTVFMNGKPFDLSRSPGEFHHHLRTLSPRFNQQGQEDPSGMFNQAAGYNFCGNNHFSWEDTKIVAVQTQSQSLDTTDSLVGGSIQLWGHYNEYLRTTFNRARWVDTNPSQNNTAQIYAGQVTLYEQGTNANTPYLFSSDIDCVHSARWMHSGHILESSSHYLADEFSKVQLFQFSVLKTSNYFVFNKNHSPCLQVMQEALTDNNILGLSFQYVLFNMSSPLYPDTPVYYDLVGSVGLWKQQELATYPAGRILKPQAPHLGAIALQLAEKHVSLNLSATLPFTHRAENATFPTQPTHPLGNIANLGTLTLKTHTGTILANINYDNYQQYWTCGGIVDTPLLSDEHGTLILSSNQGQWLESEWVLQTDSPHQALDAPDKKRDMIFSYQIPIRSYYRGKPQQKKAITIHINNTNIADCGTARSISTDHTGQTQLTIFARQSGSTRVLLDDSHCEIGIRVLSDNWYLNDVPAQQVDYAFLYQHVMAYYELVYPFMADKVFSLADQCKCETYARLMWQMCDPLNRDKSYYMPSTRELSTPQASLFLKYLINIESQSTVASTDTTLSHLKQKKCLHTSISNRDQLIEALKTAINLELSIMQQYIYAAYSIPNFAQGQRYVEQGAWTPQQLDLACGGSDRRRNAGLRGLLLEIAHEEMIHYLVVNNLLMSIGEPFYPGQVLIGQQATECFGLDTEFSFEPFSENVLAKFVRFEWPNYLPSPGPSISDLYSRLRQGFIELPNIFRDESTNRTAEHHLFLNELTNQAYPAYQLQVTNLQSALFAIDFVTEQGEGISPNSPHFEHSHFCRFRRIAQTLTNQFTPFEPALPVIKNPVLEYQTGCTTVTNHEARKLMALYQQCYELTFQMMVQHFGQHPLGSTRRSRLMNGAIDMMTGLLRPLSTTIMSLPSGIPGRLAGPPIPSQLDIALIPDYAEGCKTMAKRCQTLAKQAHALGPHGPGKAPIEILEFFNNHLTELALGTITREA